MKHLYKTVALFFVIILLSSCATLFTKTTYPVTFNTNPSDATLTIVNKKGYEIFKGQTPATVMLKSSDGYFSKAEYYVSVSMPGYNDFTTVVTADLEGWYFGNIFLGGLIGMLIVDPASGAMWTIKTEIVNINLIPNDSHSLQVLTIDKIPDNLKEHLVELKAKN